MHAYVYVEPVCHPFYHLDVAGRTAELTPGRMEDDEHRTSNPIWPRNLHRATSHLAPSFNICSNPVDVPARHQLVFTAMRTCLPSLPTAMWFTVMGLGGWPAMIKCTL